MTRKETFNSEQQIDVETGVSLRQESFQVDTAPTPDAEGEVTSTVAADGAGDFYITFTRKDTATVLHNLTFSFESSNSMPVTVNIPSADSDYSIIVKGGIVK